MLISCLFVCFVCCFHSYARYIHVACHAVVVLLLDVRLPSPHCFFMISNFPFFVFVHHCFIFLFFACPTLFLLRRRRPCFLSFVVVFLVCFSFIILSLDFGCLSLHRYFDFPVFVVCCFVVVLCCVVFGVGHILSVYTKLIFIMYFFFFCLHFGICLRLMWLLLLVCFPRSRSYAQLSYKFSVCTRRFIHSISACEYACACVIEFLAACSTFLHIFTVFLYTYF